MNQAVDRGQCVVGGTGHSKPHCYDGRAGEGMSRLQILTQLMPSVPEAGTEDGGGEGHLPKDLVQKSRVI